MGSAHSKRQQYPYPGAFAPQNGAAGYPNMFPQQAFPQFGGPQFNGQGPPPFNQFNQPNPYAASQFPSAYAPSGLGGGGWGYDDRPPRRRRTRRRRRRTRSRSRSRERDDYEPRSRSIPPAQSMPRAGGRPVHTPYPTHVPSLAPSLHAAPPPQDQVPIPGRDISQVLHPPTPVVNPSVYGPPGSQHGHAGTAASFNGQYPPGFVPSGPIPPAGPVGGAYAPHPSGIGHLPFHPSLPSPLANALPPPPRDLYELEPYKGVLDMKTTGTLLAGSTSSALGGLSMAAGAVPQQYVQVGGKQKVKSKSHTGHSSTSGGGGLANLFRSFSSSTRHRKHQQQPPRQEPNVILVPVFKDRDESGDTSNTTMMPGPVGIAVQ